MMIRLDDTQHIKDAITVAKASYPLASGTAKYHSVIYYPPGVYRVSSEITVTNGEFYGCRLEGANTEAVKIIHFRFHGNDFNN